MKKSHTVVCGYQEAAQDSLLRSTRCLCPTGTVSQPNYQLFVSLVFFCLATFWAPFKYLQSWSCRHLLIIPVQLFKGNHCTCIFISLDWFSNELVAINEFGQFQLIHMNLHIIVVPSPPQRKEDALIFLDFWIKSFNVPHHEANHSYWRPYP